MQQSDHNAIRKERRWAVLIEVSEDLAARRLQRNITTFWRVGAHYRRTHEEHALQIHRRADIERALRAAGFVVRVSGCASYICRPTSSSVAIVGSTNCGPKRFASQLSPRDRQRGRRGGTVWPAAWRRCSQNPACLSSTMARRTIG